MIDDLSASPAPPSQRFIVTGTLGHLPRRAYRVRELVEMLGLPKSTIHDLIKRGDIRAVALGSGKRPIYLVPADEVDRILGGSSAGLRSSSKRGYAAHSGELGD